MNQWEKHQQDGFALLSDNPKIAVKYVPCNVQDTKILIKHILKKAYVEQIMHQKEGQ